ncbi:slr1659 superfamily regulator [Pseudothauera lacus]|uniref:STAS domain-containing protein n=1 Tax=Pseudothauera lacus TaxID=2136175 RepID=A0A2T4IH77_9RHOO|nr:hypothetical protein [Pseudothauera lacus]PTD97066.1 hypothetical protein C8261_06660 [Pseudothauera lacus]
MNALAGDGYQAEFDSAAGCVRLCGSLRLGGLTEYAPISQLLEDALDGRSALTVDLSTLEFLNSSGIATLSKFVISARNRKDCALTIRGSSTIPWQGKSLNNLKRLMPSLELVFD